MRNATYHFDTSNSNEIIDGNRVQTSINTWKFNPATNFEWSAIYDHVPCEQAFMWKGVVGD